MVAIIRRYQLLAGFVDQFTRAFGSDGEWAALFSKSDGFLGMILLEGVDGTYLTIDQWRSEADFAGFIRKHRLEYDELSRITEGWALETLLIGRFRCDAGASGPRSCTSLSVGNTGQDVQSSTG